MAGVSVATISRVLNHPERVLPETRSRVLEVMREQNYTPNWFARGLNRAKTNTIALLVPNIEYGTYQKIISGIETVAYNKENAVFLCNTRNNADAEHSYLNMVLSRRVDGIVLVSSLLDDSHVQLLAETTIPLIHIGKRRIRDGGTVCYLDYERDVSRLVQHLVDMGHRRIDLLQDSAKNRESSRVEVGFLHAAGAAGVLGTVHYGENSVQGGYVTARRLIQDNDIPAALITASNEQALGVLKAARDVGLPIPDRLALAAMTDSDICSIVTPAVTSMEQPALRLGMVAARMLFDEIENETLEIGVPQEVILQSKIKIRHSCGNTKYIYEWQD